jgi:hypothetical protein
MGAAALSDARDRQELGAGVFGREDLEVNPWRSVPVDGEFCLPVATKFAARAANYYLRKYDLQFRVRKGDLGFSIVRRIR